MGAKVLGEDNNLLDVYLTIITIKMIPYDVQLVLERRR